jgi:hypothetical protein
LNPGNIGAHCINLSTFHEIKISTKNAGKNKLQEYLLWWLVIGLNINKLNNKAHSP